MKKIDKKESNNDLKIRQLLNLYAVGSSLTEKETLIFTLKQKVFKKQILEGSLQTENDLRLYVEGFLECYKMLE